MPEWSNYPIMTLLDDSMRGLLDHASANPKPKVMQTSVADFCGVMIDSVIDVRVAGSQEHQLFMRQYGSSRLKSKGNLSILTSEFQVLLFAAYLRAVSDFVQPVLVDRVQDRMLVSLEKKCAKKRHGLLPFTAYLDRMTTYSEASARYPTLRFVPVGSVFSELVYHQGWPKIEDEEHLMVKLGMYLYLYALDQAGAFAQQMAVY